LGAEREVRLSPLHRHPRQRDLEAQPAGRQHLGLSYNAGFRGPDVWRWGAVQNNGYERTDPRFEEFAMIGADGLTVDREGRVIVASFAGRSLDRIEKNGKRTVLADSYQGKRFNGPNDVVVKRDGAIYFTDTYAGSSCATRTRARSSISMRCSCGRPAS
jgi:sugar lactone lactonase YvrE